MELLSILALLLDELSENDKYLAETYAAIKFRELEYIVNILTYIDTYLLSQS